MRAVKTADPQVTAVLLAVVDIVALTSTLLVCGRVEASLATEAYGGELSADGETLELPGLVSRKKDLNPAITKAVKGGWTPPREVVEEHEKARRISQNFDAEKSPGASQPALKRSRSMAEVASGDVVVDYSEEPSGKIVRKDVSASGGGA